VGVDALGDQRYGRSPEHAQRRHCIARFTRVDSRFLEHLFSLGRAHLEDQQLDTISDDVIGAAASTLVIGV